MERGLRSQLIRGGSIYAVLFASLFILHIIFAANDYDLAFKRRTTTDRFHKLNYMHLNLVFKDTTAYQKYSKMEEE